ncbi:MAG: transketolase [Gammaproteobacteria bacterium]|nr:transketolase [Gammaproteobacteria bacterium]
MAGTAAGEAEGSDRIDPADAGFVREIYARAAFIRAFEAKALALTRSDPPRVAGSIHVCAGQEIVPLAALAALAPDDQVIATYRGHGWVLAAGLDPEQVFAEICHRRSGLNGGRAGSAYLMAPHTRFLGENSIVGAGTTIACGVALGNVVLGNGRVVIVAVGDGAMNQGAVHEALAFAAARRLPVIFVCENNGWSELTATRDMFPVERLARRAIGYGIAGETVSGIDPIAVRSSIARAARRARTGEGPSLVECVVPRLWGHYNRDVEHYRPRADKQAAQARDPLTVLARRLAACGLMAADEVDRVRAAQEAAIERLAERALEAPDADAGAVLDHVIAAPLRRAPPPRVSAPVAMSYLQAVNAALRAELEGDARTIVYGEDVGKAGGIFGATKNLQRDFGAQRVFDMPIAENAILGSAVGAALTGLRPIVEIMWADFVFVALDQLVNQAANVRYLTEGRASVPLVVRMQQGATPGSCAQHSQSIEALLAHVPGLKVALAATPQDAYDLLRAAAADPDPCIVIESRALYALSGPVAYSDGAEPAGVARWHRRGTDAIVISWGAMLQRVLAAAEALARTGVEVGVLDLRWLSPLDEQALAEVAAHAGGRVLIVHEAVRSGGFAAEVAMRIQEIHGGPLAYPVRRLTSPDIRMPAAPALQAAVLPDVASIVHAVRALMHDPSAPAV